MTFYKYSVLYSNITCEIKATEQQTKEKLITEKRTMETMVHPSGRLFVPLPLQKSKALILIHAARVGNNRHRVFVLLCARCLKPCLRGVRLRPLAKPSSKRKEAQGDNALCLHAEVSVSDKCRERLERRVRYNKKHVFV
jgi:hypothetical protein